VSQPVAYWDSSALIPLCVPQPQSARASVLYSQYQVVAWWASQVEMMSGFARLKRMGQISQRQYLAAKTSAMDIVRDWISAASPPAIAHSACALLETNVLSAADALQLAVALEICRQRPRGYLFVAADLRLAEAARQSGFTVEFL
jgi:predicted nucleic acid-binding protein